MISSVLLLLCLISISQCSFVFIFHRLATADQLPHRISLQSAYTYSYFCGGALITDTFIVTAAHCVEERRAASIIAVAGVVDLIQPNPNRRVRKVRQIIMHREYDLRDSWRNNIALLRVKAFPRTRYIQPIHIHTLDSLEQDRFLSQELSSGVISGYGRLDATGPMFDKLHVATAIVRHRRICEQLYEPNMRLFITQICAYDPVYFNTTRIVDVGSPLIIDGKLAGIASHTRDHKDYSIVFTFIPSYSSWIFTQIA